MLCGQVYIQSLRVSLSLKLASGTFLIIPTEEKQTDADKSMTAECGGLHAFLLLIAVACFSSFGSGSGLISKVCLGSFFFHWFLPYFEALLFSLTQLLCCPKECVEVFSFLRYESFSAYVRILSYWFLGQHVVQQQQTDLPARQCARRKKYGCAGNSP